jgi:hypothetical protein
MGFANQDLTRGSVRTDDTAIQDLCAAPWSDRLRERGSKETGGIEHVVPHLPEVMRRIDDLAGERPAAGTTWP